MGRETDAVGDTTKERDEDRAVSSFTRVMREKLRENRHKGGWLGADWRVLLVRLRGELAELEAELDRDPKTVIKHRVTSECADVANFAMMISDVYGDDS